MSPIYWLVQMVATSTMLVIFMLSTWKGLNTSQTPLGILSELCLWEW